jgi:N-methylhydantoinase B
VAIDKVTLQILANHCRAAAESMAYTLYRTAHSTFVKETEDFTTGLTTPDGKTFAAPKDLGATWFVGLDYGNVISRLSEYEPGDVCLTNDPYSGFVCTHSPDLHLWKPIFHAEKLTCFAVTHIHNTDVGGAVPASLSRTLTEVHQEGIRIPPVKLFRAGKLNQEVLDIMLTNVRVPEQNWGDLKAQLAALNTGEKKVHDMIAKFGVEEFSQGIHDLLDYAEQQTRAIIRTIPDGEYFFCDYVDEDAVGGPPCRLALNMKVQGDSIIFDFTGSDPQLNSSLNVPTGGFERHTLLLVAIFHAFYTFDPGLVLNTGITRPFRCILPEGTVVNPRFPAAVGMRSLTALRLQDVVFGCLSQALPEKMPAAPAGSIAIMNVATTDDQTGKRVMAAIDPLVGGGGGLPFADGPNGSGSNASFLKNTPVEINEAEVPIEIMKYELARDSGGAGYYRGGLGTHLEFKVFSPNTMITARNRDRTRFRAWGVLGGKAGKPSQFFVNPGTVKEKDLGNTDIFTAEPHDVIKIVSSGGGGWGDPLNRDAQAVLTDVRRGFVSVAAAEREYGVVIRDNQVDVEATEGLRRQLRQRRQMDHFDFGPEREEFEKVWSKENYTALTEVLSSVPVHWRSFVKAKIFEVVKPGQQQSGDGADVYRAFDDLARLYPRIRREEAQPCRSMLRSTKVQG